MRCGECACCGAASKEIASLRNQLEELAALGDVLVRDRERARLQQQQQQTPASATAASSSSSSPSATPQPPPSSAAAREDTAARLAAAEETVRMVAEALTLWERSRHLERCDGQRREQGHLLRIHALEARVRESSEVSIELAEAERRADSLAAELAAERSSISNLREEKERVLRVLHAVPTAAVPAGGGDGGAGSPFEVGAAAAATAPRSPTVVRFDDAAVSYHAAADDEGGEDEEDEEDDDEATEEQGKEDARN